MSNAKSVEMHAHDCLIPCVGVDNMDRLLCGVQWGPELSDPLQPEPIDTKAWGREHTCKVFSKRRHSKNEPKYLRDSVGQPCLQRGKRRQFAVACLLRHTRRRAFGCPHKGALNSARYASVHQRQRRDAIFEHKTPRGRNDVKTCAFRAHQLTYR